MTIWQRIKHFFGFHGNDSDNEWLDGRLFIDHWVRTYNCKTCNRIYSRYGHEPNGSYNYQRKRMRERRDADQAQLREYFDAQAQKYKS